MRTLAFPIALVALALGAGCSLPGCVDDEDVGYGPMTVDEGPWLTITFVDHAVDEEGTAAVLRAEDETVDAGPDALPGEVTVWVEGQNEAYGWEMRAVGDAARLRSGERMTFQVSRGIGIATDEAFVRLWKDGPDTAFQGTVTLSVDWCAATIDGEVDVLPADGNATFSGRFRRAPDVDCGEEAPTE